MERLRLRAPGEISDNPVPVHRPCRSAERSQQCPVCQERVHDLRAHAIAAHLPWFVDVGFACFVCRRQLNRRHWCPHHRQAVHPQDAGIVSTDFWPWSMHELLEQIASELSLGLQNLPGFVMENGLAAPVMSLPLGEDEEYYFYSKIYPEGLDLQAWDPCVPTSVQELAHWSIILNLLWHLGPHIAAELPAHSLVPEVGVVFVQGNRVCPQCQTRSAWGDNHAQE